jgi:N-acetylglutamate synthase-like GNAT family acetyltransferase
MNSGVFLAAAGNIGLVACAAIDTAAAVSYAVRARGGTHGAWWRSPVGLHLMCFMAAFAVVLDLSAAYLLATGRVLAAAPGYRPDWFAWLRVIAFDALIPPVLAWRLWLIWKPPK